MSDYSELKELAELAKTAGFEVADSYTEDRYYGFDEVAYIDFAQKASPEVVLALIAENKANKERADAEQESYDSQRRVLDAVKAERDQLKAENERLTNNRDMWKSQSERQAKELEALRSAMSKEPGQ